MAFYIRAGMNGGYGGVENLDWVLVDVYTLRQAEDWAYAVACEEFESSGEFDEEGYLDEFPDADDEEIEVAYREDRDSWIDYEAAEFGEDPNE